MAHVDDQRVTRVLDALEAQHPGAQLLVNDPWSIYYLTGFYADMFERFCGVLLTRATRWSSTCAMKHPFVRLPPWYPMPGR